MAKRICSVEDCGRVATRRGWCIKHYSRWYLTGTIEYKPPTLAERFWAKVDKDGPEPEPHTLAAQRDLGNCWLWTSATWGRGRSYGCFSIGKKQTRSAHQVAYELVVGPIPDGLEPDHLCERTLCVRPDHLEPVTHRVNVLRSDGPCAVHSRQTHCINGHEFTPENTYITRRGGRDCKTCNRIRKAQRRAQTKGES